MSLERLVRVFDSREAVNVYQTRVGLQIETAMENWRRVFATPIGQLNSALEAALTGACVALDSCWEEIAGLEGGRVRRIEVNGQKKDAQQLRVTDSRVNGEAARLDISFRYPYKSGPHFLCDWEVYTLSLNYYADEEVIVPDNKGHLELVIIEVRRPPVLSLQVSEAPCKRMGLVPQFLGGGDYHFDKYWQAKKIFVQGIERVCQFLKEPGVGITPQKG